MAAFYCEINVIDLKQTIYLIQTEIIMFSMFLLQINIFSKTAMHKDMSVDCWPDVWS